MPECTHPQCACSEYAPEEGCEREPVGTTGIHLPTVEAIAAWLQHIERLDEIPGARAGLPATNPLWDAADAIRRRFGGA